MEMVKLIALGLALSAIAAASDFSIEVGSPIAAMTAENTARVKKTGGAFSVRTKGCADAGSARFSGIAVWMNGSKRESARESANLQLIAGTAPGSYVVASMDRMTEPWVAVITAECSGVKAGALVPVSGAGVYDRGSTRLVSHAPTDAEVEASVKQAKGGSQ